MLERFDANILGLAIVEKPEMMGSGWFLKDGRGCTLRAGAIGLGEIRTPGADQNTATTLECGSDLFAALMAIVPEVPKP